MTKKINQPENKLVIKPILRKLETLKLSGDVLWVQRLVAEDDINCPSGTPDIVVIVNCKNGKIALLFIECKRPSDKKSCLDDLRFEQRLFFDDMAGEPMTLCVVINDKRQLWLAIKRARSL